MGIVSIANSNDSDHFLSLFLRPLDRHYQIRFYSIPIYNPHAQSSSPMLSSAPNTIVHLIFPMLCPLPLPYTKLNNLTDSLTPPTSSCSAHICHEINTTYRWDETMTSCAIRFFMPYIDFFWAKTSLNVQ